MYYVYILISKKDKGLYIGFTSNLKQRIARHHNKEVFATKHRDSLILIHYEGFLDKEDAMSREEFLKSGYGRKNLYKMLQRTLKKYGFMRV